MYTLVLLSLVAVLLLASSKREGLQATPFIKAPPYNTVEVNRIWDMIPQSAKMEYLQSNTGRVGPNGADRSAAEATQFGKTLASEIVLRFYETVYALATAPITMQQVNNFASGTPAVGTPQQSREDVRKFAVAVVKAYFIDQVGTTGSGTPTPNTSSGNWATSGSYNQIRAQFDVKKGQYDALIAQLSTSTNPTADDIIRLRNLNREASALLEQAIRALSTSQVENMTAVNQELAEMLSRIERQYNILVENSDRLEALRRIREFEEVKAGGNVNFFMVLLLVFSLALLVIMMFSQRMNATSPTAPTSPAMTANLT